MNEKKRRLVRVIAGVLAVLMGVTVLAGVMSTLVSASRLVVQAANVSVEQIKKDENVSFTFRIPSLPSDLGSNGTFEGECTLGLTISHVDNNPIALTDVWNVTTPVTMSVMTDTSGTTMTLSNLPYVSDKNYRFLTISNMKCTSGKRFDGSTLLTEVKLFENTEVVVEIPSRYFSGPIVDDSNGGSSGGGTTGGTTGGGSTSGSGDYTYASNIVFESASVTRNGKALHSVDKDSEPFDVEVTFTDTGLRRAELDSLRGTSVDVFFTPGGAFSLTGTTRGSIRLVTNTSSRYPRFKVEFSNVTYSGSGNDLGFQVYYLFGYMDDPVKGEGKGIITEAKSKDSSEDEDANKLGVPVPKVIIGNYSYGEQTITAGDEFKLSFTIDNTSTQVPLENIVITLTPTSNAAQEKGPGLIVAASSNTIYVPALEAGASIPYSVAFQARPDAEVTSHLIEVKFSYEYIDVQKKTREKAEMTENIAIPVSQIDRFTVDPLTESAFAEVGQETYLTLTYINKGKSKTYNVTATARVDNEAVSVSTEHIGNVDAGASDSVDIAVSATEPGEYSGDVVFTYEDENNNTKEITTPFTITVEQPFVPPVDEALPPETPPEGGQGIFALILCIIGGGAVAGPIAMYLVKRVKAKASADGEDFDEDI